MLTPEFIRFGKDSNAVFRFSQIAAVSIHDKELNDINRNQYQQFLENKEAVVAYLVQISMIGGHGSIDYVYEEKEKRDDMFGRIVASLSPHLITRHDSSE